MLSPALPPTLSLVLALVVGFGSLFCFSLGFVAPRLYRRQDLVWSGVGLFYALVLWFCSAQIRGAILLGTIANVALLGWLGSQTYLSRWEHLTEAAKAEGAVKWLRIWGQKMTHFIESSVVRVAKSRSSQPSPVLWVRSPKPEVAQGSVPEGSEKSTPEKSTPQKSIVAPETASFNKSLSNSLSESEIPASIVPNPIVPNPIAAPLEPLADESLESSESSLQPAETSIVPPSPTVPATPAPESSPTLAKNAVSENPSDEDWGDLAEAEEPVLAPATEAETSRLKAIVAQPLPKTGLLGRIQNFFQGRKNHGKRFLRPDESPDQPLPASKAIVSEPSVLELVEFPEPIEPVAVAEVTPPTESEQSESAPESTPESTPETPEQPEDVSPGQLEDVSPGQPENVSPGQPEDVSPEQPEDVSPEPEELSPEQPEKLPEAAQDTGNIQQTGKMLEIAEIIDKPSTQGAIVLDSRSIPDRSKASIVSDSQPEESSPESNPEPQDPNNPIEGKMVPLFPVTQPETPSSEA